MSDILKKTIFSKWKCSVGRLKNCVLCRLDVSKIPRSATCLVDIQIYILFIYLDVFNVCFRTFCLGMHCRGSIVWNFDSPRCESFIQFALNLCRKQVQIIAESTNLLWSASWRKCMELCFEKSRNYYAFFMEILIRFYYHWAL